MISKLLRLLLVTVMIQGCGAMTTADFAKQEPALDLFTYFEGRTQAWGWFEDRFGKVRRQFQVEIIGTVDGDTLTLEEDFTYADGELDRRVWTIQRDSRGRYTGTADDVIGTARGRVEGNALNWQYDLSLEINGSKWVVQFDDWMFLQPGDVLLNRAVMSKWGIELGRVSIFFKRPDAG